jgi:light-regulated signal transduction histidine kinase (bacteriophytochrome)
MDSNQRTFMSSAVELRRRAEERFKQRSAAVSSSRTDDETKRLLHELQVHQIELEMQNTELRQSRDEVETLHSALASHAAELLVANTELEAFNYTVSHDLRKPLAVINGYCQVLQELCGEQFNAQTKEYITVIYEGTLRMSRLIDSLLRFSRVTRVEICRKRVDLSALATTVAEELRQLEPARKVTFKISTGITADADASLVRLVLENLLGNAWKYTVHQQETVIEFGISMLEGKPVCFVRDNGPGFDMADAEKMFLPFQRVPGIDVEGHGVGLATVERIVNRHGGRVWAESAPGSGATFLFTLTE